ncbi:MAG TPA: efflux RND transporter periplasmic adaptor subunit, partial [Polyangiaceae bacterium]|nr:efflux RND transporter periplasmic adaptor subunit [Polyangiaceae bacterium]
DFLLATQSAKVLSTAPDTGPSRAPALGTAARQRLRLLGMSDPQIDAIAKSGVAMESIAVPSPASGFVIEKDVVEGASVDPGMRLYRIAALGKVWVEADVYEADLAHVRVGQPAKVTLDYLPGRPYEAKVAYVYPYLDSKARTGRVRIEIVNKELELRPGMYASVSLGSDVGPRVQVPAAAVVYTGPRRLVFVDLGEGRLRPQEIHVGMESNAMFEVLDGLNQGDMVAISGVFLIAAEARISTAAKYWESSPEAEDAGAPMMMDPTTPATGGSSMPSMPGMRGASPMPMPKGPSGRSQPAMPSMSASAMAPMPMSSPGASTAPPSPSTAPSTVYTCPMHPEVRSPTPGKCPKCGMELQPMGGKP